MRLAAGDVVCVQWQRITWVVQLHAGLGQQQGMPSPLLTKSTGHAAWLTRVPMQLGYRLGIGWTS